MSDAYGFYQQTPSQAEGEREDDEPQAPELNKLTGAHRGSSREGRARPRFFPRTTPSQAEGERDDQD